MLNRLLDGSLDHVEAVLLGGNANDVFESLVVEASLEHFFVNDNLHLRINLNKRLRTDKVIQTISFSFPNFSDRSELHRLVQKDGNKTVCFEDLLFYTF